MRRIQTSLAVVLVAMLAAVSWGAAKYVQPQDVDVASILSGPPTDDSAEHQQEVATVLQWQNKRTAEDVKRCKVETPTDPFVFSQVLGDWFNARALPITANLLDAVTADSKAIANIGKDKWKRERPYKVDDRIKPCAKLEDTYSYPSGHAVRGVVWATILSEMFPEHAEQLMALGRQIGDDRVVGGVHWPSDVEAGQKLGAEIAKKMLDNADFKVDMQRAKDECLVISH